MPEHNEAQPLGSEIKMKLVVLALSLLADVAHAHSNLIYPIPRNAIDRFDPRWAGGKACWGGGDKRRGGLLTGQAGPHVNAAARRPVYKLNACMHEK